LLKRTARAEGVHAMTDKPVLHGDDASTLEASGVLGLLHWLRRSPARSCASLHSL
jgi:putative transposase